METHSARHQPILPKRPKDAEASAGLPTKNQGREKTGSKDPAALTTRQRQPKCRQATEHEWNAIKPTFEQHYAVDDLPFKDVMVPLGVDGFIASCVNNRAILDGCANLLTIQEEN